jgi:hypothetical protein
MIGRRPYGCLALTLAERLVAGDLSKVEIVERGAMVAARGIEG